MKRYSDFTRQLFVAAIFSSLILIAACDKEQNHKEKVYDNGPTDSLKINQIQIIASHNSYHLVTDSVVVAFLANLSTTGLLPAEYDPIELDYTHLPLAQQLNDYNVRGFEFDINPDPVGGQYYKRQGLSFAALPTESGIAELNEPGYKIIHIIDFDYNTNNYTFKSAINDLYKWSNEHPNHLPLFVNVEAKSDAPSDILPQINYLTKSIPYTAELCDDMDEEIKSVFGNDLQKVITPDKVRGTYGTLREAVLAGNWPTLKEARGKIIFIMQGGAETLYKAGHASLQGRAMFVYANPTSDEAAFVIRNNSTGSFTDIQQLVAQGFIVRTRTDAGTKEARSGDVTDRESAFNSGAQIISTDYYKPDSRAGTPGWTDFQVQFPNGELARINPISAAGQQSLGTIKE